MFIKYYETIAAPFTDLLQKNNFIWTKETINKAFIALKAAVTNPPQCSSYQTFHLLSLLNENDVNKSWAAPSLFEQGS